MLSLSFLFIKHTSWFLAYNGIDNNMPNKDIYILYIMTLGIFLVVLI